MNQSTLKSLADKFERLSMKNPAQRLFGGKTNTISHPYEYLIASFPTFNDFYGYFADLGPTYHGEKPFAQMLFGIYHDLRDLPLLIDGMNRGICPTNMEKIFTSMRTLNDLTRKRFALANTLLAKQYATR